MKPNNEMTRVERFEYFSEMMAPQQALMHLNRATGRTTRLIKAASEVARNGFSVLIVVNDEKHQRQLMQCADELDIDPSRFSWAHLKNRGIQVDWKNMEVHGYWVAGQKFDKIFFDAFAIEDNWQALLYELHRFDEEPK